MQHRLTDLGHDRTQFIPPRSQCARVGIAERRPQLEHDLRDAPLPAPTFRSAIAISNHSHPHSSHHPSLPPGKDRKLLSEPVIQHLFRDGERPMQSVQRDTPEENVGESGGILLWAVWEERGQPELVRLGETGNEEHK
jgi:hypothetical protein